MTENQQQVTSSRSPAHRSARVARDVVEDVLLEIRSLRGRINRTAIVDRLEDSLAALHDLRQSAVEAADHLETLERCRAAVRRAAEAVEGHSLSPASKLMCDRLLGVERALAHTREAVIDAVVAIQPDLLGHELLRRARERVPEPEAFGLSDGLPRLHALDRQPLRTNVDVSPEDFVFEDLPAEDAVELSPEEQYQADLAAVVPDDGDELPLPPVPRDKQLTLLADTPADFTMVAGIDGELTHLERIARGCLEEVGACANLRRLKDHERFRWDAQRGFEQRMCDALDMLAALAQPFFMSSGAGARYPGLDILGVTVTWARDQLTIDPTRAFASAFVLGSVAGVDTVRAALLALKQSHPHTHAEQMSALAIAPNPAIDEALVQLTSEKDSRLVNVALDGMYARSIGDVATAVALLEHPDDGVRARAARLLALSPDRQAAAALLEDMLQTEVDEDAIAAAIEALVFLGRGVGAVRERLFEELEEPGTLRNDIRARFMQLLGVAGAASDREIIKALYSGQPGEATAAGFHGHLELVPMLIDPMNPRGPEVITGKAEQREAAAALVRITGAPMCSETDGYDIATDHAAWRAWWEQNAERFDSNVRHRSGKPWSGTAAIDELERENVPVALRRLLALELGTLLEERPMAVADFASRQADVLRRQRVSIEALAETQRFFAGRWPAGSD